MTHEEYEAVYYLAKERLVRANARIRYNGGNITYQLYDEGKGKFEVRAVRSYKDVDGIHFRYLYSVLCHVDIYSAYYCACGIEDAALIHYE